MLWQFETGWGWGSGQTLKMNELWLFEILTSKAEVEAKIEAEAEVEAEVKTKARYN